MKYLILMLFIGFFVPSYANPNTVISSSLHMDKQGHLIQPDKIYLGYAFEAYQKEYNKSALTYFKKAAALGNSIAQKYVGLMHIKSLGVEESWAKGFAWIKLAASDGKKETTKLRDEILVQLTPQEVKLADIEYKKINDQYGTIAALTRRDRWVAKQKMKMLGSRTGSLVFAPILFDTPHGNGLYNQMKSFVNDFDYGYVSGGEIIPKENGERNENN